MGQRAQLFRDALALGIAQIRAIGWHVQCALQQLRRHRSLVVGEREARGVQQCAQVFWIPGQGRGIGGSRCGAIAGQLGADAQPEVRLRGSWSGRSELREVLGGGGAMPISLRVVFAFRSQLGGAQPGCTHGERGVEIVGGQLDTALEGRCGSLGLLLRDQGAARTTRRRRDAQQAGADAVVGGGVARSQSGIGLQQRQGGALFAQFVVISARDAEQRGAFGGGGALATLQRGIRRRRRRTQVSDLGEQRRVQPADERIVGSKLHGQHGVGFAGLHEFQIRRIVPPGALQHGHATHCQGARGSRIDRERGVGVAFGIGVAAFEQRGGGGVGQFVAAFAGVRVERAAWEGPGIGAGWPRGHPRTGGQQGWEHEPGRRSHPGIIVWLARAAKLRLSPPVHPRAGTEPSMTPDPMEARARELLTKVAALRTELGQQVIGQSQLVEDLLVAILAGGHVLLEGLPGLGKTRLVRALGVGLGLEFARIQFTPDLMPSDVTGTQVVDEEGGRRSFRFQRGPLFAGLVLADEINRASPKTQSALLEAMQEHSVTVAGTTHRLPEPFHVVATQNPIELEGTFPLPEAQLDRFLFRLDVRTPDAAAMAKILAATTGASVVESSLQLHGAELRELQQLVRNVLCGSHLLRFVAELVLATHPDRAASEERTRRFVRYGASARAGQAIVLGAKARALLAGRPAVTQADLDACLLPALQHRVLLGFEAEAERVAVADLLPTWRNTAERCARA